MKKGLLTGIIVAMSMGGLVAFAGKEKAHETRAELDARIIVEVNESFKDLDRKQIESSQDKVMKAISRNVTNNFKLVHRYSVLNNAFVVEVNSGDIEKIRNLDEVASVTLDEIHAKQSIDNGELYSVTFDRTSIGVPGEDSGDMVDNISAETMRKPSGTADGEGTVIAILDNEFYLRGEHMPMPNKGDDGSAWNHVVYKPLDNGVKTRFTFENLEAVLNDEENPMTAKRLKGAEAGQEGSLYFNNKVPFYFDYGGESLSYGKVGPTDYDVSSLLTYHGSHVASIASANADTYKGIAPKAQLACMKVFTTYVADDTGEQMGFGTSSGAYDSAILTALEDAILLGVDGINMSLGSDLGDFDGDSITMKTLAALASDNSIMTAISAGNAGKLSYSFTGGYGNWTTDMVETGILGSYANSTEATIIASGQPTMIYFENAIQLLDESNQGLKNIAFEDQIVNREGLDEEFPESNQHWMTEIVNDISTDVVEWQYIPGFGTAADYGDLDVSGKVVVVNRGSTSFAEKYNVAVDNRAAAVIIINNDPTATDFNFRCSFGDDFNPTIPCALALYKDKPVFESNVSGRFKFIQKDTSVNDLARTISTYSSDGARFDYSLKPDITTPGENIRGAVPPQKKEHREETPYSTYEYLSGTSMAAPNYAGAQALVLSQAYAKAFEDNELTSEEFEEVKAFRKTIDMRLMSTANPMFDSSVNPETNETVYTSPRIQGAGMVDLSKAYSTKQYLEGINSPGKSKIELKNNEDIAKGTLKLSFKVYNEEATAQNYTAKVSVMRPAIVNSNKIVQKQYNYIGEIDDVSKVPGLTYVEEVYDSTAGELVPRLKTNSATNIHEKDALKLTKQIKFYKTIEDFLAKTNEQVMEADYYYNSVKSGTNWITLPGYDYQSVQDMVIDTFTRSVTIPANANGEVIELGEYTLAKEVREDILEKYPFGCAIEGFVELQQEEVTKLSLPYLGFYSGADIDESHSLMNAPVVEPFDFEKDPFAIYPSDLVNDVTKQLVGKDNVDFGSMWTVGYADTVMDIDVDKILTNDTNLAKMNGFHRVGYDPANDAYFDNPSENIYVGNPEKTNTMIIQQFVMRSVSDNYFTIKNEKGEIVYKSVLKDMLFSDNNELYKTHVDANYLSAGYVAHRAYAIIPLYDTVSHEKFADGNYTIEFNYELSYNGGWVSKAYNFMVDSTAPEFTGVKEYTDENGEQRVRIEINDNKLCYAEMGYSIADFQYDAEKKVYYIDETKEFITQTMEEMGAMENGQKRLYIRVVDASYGETRAIIHFFGSSFSNYVMAEGSTLSVDNDFVKDGQNVKWYSIDWVGNETEIRQSSYVTIKTSFGEEFKAQTSSGESKGCGGSIIAASGIISIITLLGAGLLIKRRKEH